MESRIKSIIATQLDIEEGVESDGDLVDDYGADSLDVVEIALALEDEFGINISDEDVYKFQTVGDIIRYVKARSK